MYIRIKNNIIFFSAIGTRRWRRDVYLVAYNAYTNTRSPRNVMLFARRGSSRQDVPSVCSRARHQNAIALSITNSQTNIDNCRSVQLMLLRLICRERLFVEANISCDLFV